jgi:hypothetical protein
MFQVQRIESAFCRFSTSQPSLQSFTGISLPLFNRAKRALRIASYAALAVRTRSSAEESSVFRSVKVARMSQPRHLFTAAPGLGILCARNWPLCVNLAIQDRGQIMPGLMRVLGRKRHSQLRAVPAKLPVSEAWRGQYNWHVGLGSGESVWRRRCDNKCWRSPRGARMWVTRSRPFEG